jgi:hypothetical protein
MTPLTETEWLTLGVITHDLLARLPVTISDPKLRLAGVAFCRRCSVHLAEPLFHEAIAFAERLADGETETGERKALRRRVQEAIAVSATAAAFAVQRLLHRQMRQVFSEIARDCANELAQQEWVLSRRRLDSPATPHSATKRSEHAIQYELLREVVGNPFRHAPFDAGWRTETVRLLSDGIHADQAFDRLPILADALEEAGCDNAEMLAHCRGPGPHVRGCWALDLVRRVF